MTTVDRRTFLGGLGAASALTIVPRRVLGGSGYVAPSDMILLAQVGCGTQAQRQVNTGMVPRPDLQFVAVVDPNRDSRTTSTGRRSATATGFAASSRIRAGARATPAFAAGATSRARSWRPTTRSSDRPSRGIRSYEDFREMLEKETDIQGVVNITPDHQHGAINIAALRKGRAAISHKPVASVLLRGAAHAAGGAREPGAVASARLQQHAGSAHAGGVDQRRRDRPRPRSAQLDQSSVLAAGDAGVSPLGSAGARRASTGSCGRAPSRIARTTRATRSRSIAAGMRMARAVSATWATTVSGSRIAS